MIEVLIIAIAFLVLAFMGSGDYLEDTGIEIVEQIAEYFTADSYLVYCPDTCHPNYLICPYSTVRG